MASAKPFELTVTNLPEIATLKLGKKGSVEIDLTQIPTHLWGGPDGLLMRGLKRQLMNTMGAKPTTLPAEEMVQAWYLGYPHARAAGVGTEEPKSARDLKKEAAARAKLNKAAALDIARALAVSRTGNAKLKEASRSQLKRTLGDDFDALEKQAEKMVGK